MFAALGLTLATAGCGSSETTAEELPHLTKAQLLKKGKAICDQEAAEINARFDRWRAKNAEENKIPSQHELSEFTAKVVLPAKKMELRRLRALGIPHPGAQTYRHILIGLEEGIEEGERNHSSLVAVNEDYAFAKAFELSFYYGLDSCWVE